ncbi:MAG: hypothetical protein NWT08_10560 [Akkermansiaceae bacterium]|jgi:hypothetical protein|nr:hypothetical protein [Akkermansiaceae bacterium]MDP4781076.1 hypothetical protein [Akkermansiaceae bacterium]MDP4898686.1 hypothetical protein [Akkermansiaceae bacterium]MDP4996759.1 hypothetical protein [Akkermansiaceae bacterium]
MKLLLFVISLLCIGLQSILPAAEPTSELSEDLAKRLILEVLDIKSGGINVASVIEGEKRSEDGFVERQVRRVTAVHPILEDGRMVRRVRCYDFSWTPRYGWFYQQIGSSRSGEEVLIWSETEGELIVK